MKFKFKIKYLVIGIAVAVTVSVIIDLIRISGYQTIPMKPDTKIDCRQDEIYFELSNGDTITDWNRLDGTLKYIENEYDCADFRMVNLVRILYEYGDQIPADYLSKIENTLFNFRYWWDEPGENSMCYWSENHQVLFASAEYLIGQMYPDSLFGTSGLTGREHQQKAKTRLMNWLEMRWKFGFTEYYSNVYYIEDIGPLINLVDFANDKEISEKAAIILDLLFYDVASQNIGGNFVTVSGRAYEHNRKGDRNPDLGGLTYFLRGDSTAIKSGMTYGMASSKKYRFPEVLKEIANDTANVVIKQCNGIDIPELKKEGYFGTDNRSMMMQWCMEAFTNPEIIRNSLTHIRNSNMFSNEFVADFKYLDFTILRLLHLEPLLIRIVNPQTNGVAIQKGNTYTYKTADFTLYSVQNHHPGTYGDQQHVAGMNVGNQISIFHTHPALEADRKNQSPNYWTGYGHFPHVAQDSTVQLAIYGIPDKKGLMELDLLDYTHAWFPVEKFDTTFVSGNYAFGKKGNAYCAFITLNPLKFRENTTDNLIQEGKQVFWITEAGSAKTDGSFIDFCNSIKSNQVEFKTNDLSLIYHSKGKQFSLNFGGDFYVNGNRIETKYQRFDSPYSKTETKPQMVNFEHNGKSLLLDFYNLKRIEN